MKDKITLSTLIGTDISQYSSAVQFCKLESFLLLCWGYEVLLLQCPKAYVVKHS